MNAIHKFLLGWDVTSDREWWTCVHCGVRVSDPAQVEAVCVDRS